MMVLSGMSPLFVLWAIRGASVVPDGWFFAMCAAFVVIPNAFLWLRIRSARKHNQTRELVVGSSEDHRDHLLVYLFATLLPFYSESIATWRELLATIAALGFIAFLFWHLNLHYMNVWFALRGYRVFTIYAPDDGNPISGRYGLVVITPRVSLRAGDRVMCYRLSDTVYLEKDP